MLFPAGTKQSGPVLNISVVPANDQTARIQGAIARRAFLPSRPYFPGHELEDWLKAESELVSPLCYGLMTNDEEMWVGTSVAEFKRGTIEIWVSPRLITISGESVGRNEGKQSATAQRERLIFRWLGGWAKRPSVGRQKTIMFSSPLPRARDFSPKSPASV